MKQEQFHFSRKPNFNATVLLKVSCNALQSLCPASTMESGRPAPIELNVVTSLLYDGKVAGKSAVNIALRTAFEDDVAFARNLYFETMCGVIERLFGWEHDREENNFARFFKLDEVRIISADGQDFGWIPEQISEENINLGSFYIAPTMQRRASELKFYECFWKGRPANQKLCP